MTSFCDTATTNSSSATPAAATAFDAIPMRIYTPLAGISPAAAGAAAGERRMKPFAPYDCGARLGRVAPSGTGDSATTAPCSFVEQLARAIGEPVFTSLAYKSKVNARL